MVALDRPHLLRRAAASIAVVALLGGVALFTAMPVGAGSPLLTLTLSKTTAVSNASGGDSIQVSGSNCTPPANDLVNVLLFQGAFAPGEVPSGINILGIGISPDNAGNWTGTLPIPGGVNALTPGQYTVRAACFPHGSGTAAFYYANAVITITDGTVTPTTPPPTTTPVTPVEPTTTPQRPATPAASPAARAAVATTPAYTG